MPLERGVLLSILSNRTEHVVLFPFNLGRTAWLPGGVREIWCDEPGYERSLKLVPQDPIPEHCRPPGVGGEARRKTKGL